MRIAAGTDPGKLRGNNEDCYRIIGQEHEGVPVCILIADGMGGHSAGEIASSMAVETAGEMLKARLDECGTTEDNFFKLLKEIFQAANLAVFEKSLENNELKGMGTTLIAAVIHEKTLYIAHVGDSRVYVLSGGAILRVTHDHSLIEELIRNGSISREEAEHHPKKNIITKAVGCGERIEIDTYRCSLNPGDRILFCTDGLTNMVKEVELQEILLEPAAPEEQCTKVIDLSNERGGPDNITAVIVHIE